jgi:hypothetical protein
MVAESMVLPVSVRPYPQDVSYIQYVLNVGRWQVAAPALDRVPTMVSDASGG